ncbi:MAG: FAD binding domain-containing protein [Acidimicrobiia bacterium]
MSYAYHRPRSLDEALGLVAEVPGARFIGGGTDLLVQMNGGDPPPALISLRDVPELDGVEDGERLRIGAAVPFTDIAAHQAVRTRLPALVDSIRVIGSPQIRNVATLGGNLCNASPGADAAPPLLVYGTAVELRGPAGVREMPLDEFFTGPGATAKAPDEILVSVLVDPQPEGARTIFLRKGRVKMDIAIASVAVQIETDGAVVSCCRIAAGAVAPVPMRLPGTEAVVAGSALDDTVVALARARAREEVAPITDVRATARYRTRLVGVYVQRALEGFRDPGGSAP